MTREASREGSAVTSVASAEVMADKTTRSLMNKVSMFAALDGSWLRSIL